MKPRFLPAISLRATLMLALVLSPRAYAQEEPPSDTPSYEPTFVTDDTTYHGDSVKDSDGNDLIWYPNSDGTGRYVYGGFVSTNSSPGPIALPDGAVLPTIGSGDVPQSHTNSDPVLGSGEFVLTQTDLDIPGFGMPFRFTRVYRSRVNYLGSMGFGWSHNFQRRIVATTPQGAEDCAGDILYISESMERIRFSVSSTSLDGNHVVYSAGPDIPLRLDRYRDHLDEWELRDGSPQVSYFDGATGTLDRIVDRAGNTITVNWDHSIRNDEEGVVSSVRDTTGRVFYFHYDTVHPTEAQDTAILNCISLSAYTSDCAPGSGKALISFEVSDDAKSFGSFDLLRTRDANGIGPSYSYYRTAATTKYAADADLGPVCHNYCDVKGTDANTCHNLDFCTTEVNALTAKACDMDSVNTKPFICAGQLDPDACKLKTTAHFYTSQNSQDYKEAPFFDLVPFWLYPISSHGLLTGYIRYLDDWRHDPGYGFCLIACTAQNPPTACYSDVFPLCRGLGPVEQFDDADPGGGGSEELGSSDRFLYRQACGCMYGQNVTYCSFHPSDKGCSTLLNRVTGIPHVEFDHKVVGLGQPAHFFEKYAQACLPIVESRIRAANPNCPSQCYQGCLAQLGAHDSTGTRRYAFGRAEELDHNLIEVYDGDGRLVLRNTYGIDPFQQSFDRVTSHQLTDSQPDNVITFAYHDLQLEQAKQHNNLPLLLSSTTNAPPAANGLASRTFDASGMDPASQYNLTLDPIHVQSLDQFQSLEVCPEVCSSILSTVVKERDNNLIPPAAFASAERALLTQSPLVLRHRADGTVTIDTRKPPNGPGNILHLDTPAGRVTLTQSRESSLYQLSGDQRAIGSLFGSHGQFSLRETIDGSNRRTVTNAQIDRRADVPVGAAPTQALAFGHREPAIIRHLHEAAVEQLRAQAPKGANATSPLASPGKITEELINTGFSSFLRAEGYAVGSTPLTFKLQGRNTARLGGRFADGDEVARIRAGDSLVSLFATNEAGVFRTDDHGAALFDGEGLARIAINADGTIVGEPAAELRTGAAEYLKRLGNTAPDSISEASASSCKVWAIFPAKNISPASSIQNPRYAVVVHDVRGVIETRYYDETWRLLREVNQISKEQTDYNYLDGTVHGTRYPAGDRQCINADRFGRPLEIQRLPAPNFSGDSGPQVIQFTYSADGAVAEIIRDPGTPDQSTVHVGRDSAGRPHIIESTVDAKHKQRVTLAYASAAKTDGPDWYPNSITQGDGFQIALNKYDPGGGGPTETTIGGGDSNARVALADYDAFGRPRLLRRAKHPGSETYSKYDPAGRLIASGAADLTASGKWVETTVTYNNSNQPVLESSENLNRCTDSDALNHRHWVNELPKDGVTEARASCFRTGVDGKLDYVVTPIGSVQIYQYDANGRLEKRREGYPTDMSAWTSACLNNLPAPSVPRRAVGCRASDKSDQCLVLRSAISTAAARRVNVSPAILEAGQEPAAPQVSVVGNSPSQRLPATPNNALKARRDSTQTRVAAASATPVAQFSVCSANSPSWPTGKPANDKGIEITAEYVFGPGGFPKAIVDGQGIGLHLKTDGFGRIIAAMDGNKNQLWRGFDTRNRITWQATVGPTSKLYGRPQALDPQLPLVSMEEFSYDHLDRVVNVQTWNFADGKQVDPTKLKIVTAYTYDDTLDRVSVSIDGKPAGQIESDGLGRNKVLTLADGTKITFEYTDSSNGDMVTAHYFANGQSIERRVFYDNHGQAVRTLDRLGSEIESRVYDRFDRKISVTEVQSDLTGFGYDAYDRIVTWTKGKTPRPDQTVRFTWDRGDRPTSVVTTNGTLGPNVTTNIFDGLNRLIEADEPEGRQRLLSYFSGSSRVQRIDQAGGSSLTYTYDPSGRPRELSVVPGAASGLDSAPFKRRYAFNPLGLLSSARVLSGAPSATNLTTTFNYDSRGNQIAESTNGFLPIDIYQTYDSFGALLDTTLAAHTGIAKSTIHRTREPLGRLTDTSLNDMAVAKLNYGGLGAPTQIDFGPQAPNGYPVVATANFDQRGRALGTDVRMGSTTVASIKHWLGPDGIARVRDLQFSNGIRRTDVFEVDDTGRLLAEGLGATLPSHFSDSGDVTNSDVDSLIAPSSEWHRYSVDGLGNWASVQDATGTALNSVDALNGYTLFGGLQATYDANRNLTALNTRVNTFDALGELTSSANGLHKEIFSYDALGRRIAKTDTMSGLSNFTVWSGNTPIAMGTDRTAFNRYTIQIPGDRINDHLALLGNFGAGAAIYLHQAANQSTFAVTTDHEFIEGFDYSAFGKTVVLQSNTTSDVRSSRSAAQTFGSPFLYQGQSYDVLLQQYNMRAREYEPALGRFLTPDPIGMAGGYNLYAFANSAPLAYTDPFGLDPSAGTWTRALTSDTFQNVYQTGVNQAFGTGNSAWTRVVGAGNLLAAPFAVAEQISNVPGAFIGNTLDRTRLITQGRLGDADAVSLAAGQRIRTGLLDVAAVYAIADAPGVLGGTAKWVGGAATRSYDWLANVIRPDNASRGVDAITRGLGAGSIPYQQAVNTGLVKSEKLTNILQAIQERFIQSPPKSMLDAWGLTRLGAVDAGFELPGPAAGGLGHSFVSFINPGGITTKILADGQIIVTKGDNILLKLVP